MPLTTSPIAKTLTQIGLSEKEATVYEALLNLGKANMGKLLPKVPYKRGNTYDILEDLKNKGLVTEAEERGKKIFIIGPPDKLQGYLESREKSVVQAKANLKNILPDLKSAFNLITERPNIKFFEGIEGMKQIYDDILEEGQDIQLVRANYEPVFEKQIVPIVNNFIKTRMKHNQKVTAITPMNERANPKNRKPDDDKTILMQRNWVSAEKYSAPVEIDIYGDKVALLSFSKELVGVIIESPQISEALKQVFELARLGAAKSTPLPPAPVP
ncbi:MAG: helix-turn-helix domain-containing protein [Patescibacteria group bacterium]